MPIQAYRGRQVDWQNFFLKIVGHERGNQSTTEIPNPTEQTCTGCSEGQWQWQKLFYTAKLESAPALHIKENKRKSIHTNIRMPVVSQTDRQTICQLFHTTQTSTWHMVSKTKSKSVTRFWKSTSGKMIVQRKDDSTKDKKDDSTEKRTNLAAWNRKWEQKILPVSWQMRSTDGSTFSTLARFDCVLMSTWRILLWTWLFTISRLLTSFLQRTRAQSLDLPSNHSLSS